MNNLNIFTLVSFLIASTSIFAQKKITLIDSKTNNPIPFYGLNFNNNLFYSNKNGIVDILEYNATDTLFFEMPEFESKKVLVNDVKDTVYLNFINENLLDEITININKTPIKIKTTSNRVTATPIKPGREIIEKVIFSENYIGSHIKKITASINRDFITYNKKRETKNYEICLRINFYDYNLNKIESSEPITFKQQKRNLLEFELTNKIKIPKEEIHIGVEFIGVIDTNGNFESIDDFYLRPLIFIKESNEVNSNIYIRNNTSKKRPDSIYNIINHQFKRYKNIKNVKGNTHIFSYEIQ
ncbi:hypothetical protein MG290_11320 [Flavobacterium sp. CBA20B-1]|uniref:hypothetical protein n=1 Tax=unclassified Flavobacterium TaxID=196869 RepID=UPI002225AAF0|nr:MULTISPECIES: hypothetical protein [unclassified Flavobacterium]WCM41534.1 hypothetical protein MG290_11320 [Flavobacterium sp. CBA20B-1]